MARFAAARTLALWTRTETAVTLWRWQPGSGEGLVRWLVLPTWDIPFGPSYGVTVLVSPDGTKIALAEHAFGDPASHDRTRVFDETGTVLWTLPDGQPRAVDMAWSPDGSMLALGAVPSPWTVVRFATDGTAHATTFTVGTKDAAYRLLGFSPDHATVVGYETTGEAGFWQKPVVLDLATGRVSPLAAWPAGMMTNATGPVDQVNPDGGSVLARSGEAKGPADWVIREAAGERSLGLDPAAQPAWWTPGTIAWALAAPPSVPGPTEVRTRPVSDTSGGTLVATLPRAAGDSVELAPSAGGVLLLASRSAATYPGGDPGWRDYTVVDLATGATDTVTSPAAGPLGTGLWFAGWLSRGG